MRIEEPLPTRLVAADDLLLKEGSTYLFGMGVEDRALIDSDWRRSMESRSVSFVCVDEGEDTITFGTHSGALGRPISMRHMDAIADQLSSCGHIYLDITGMTYSAWAPILRAVLHVGVSIEVVYVEPLGYARSQSPTPGMQFDLSDRFEGLSPIPGFASIARQRSPDWVLVAALGFEGQRFSHLINKLEPPEDRIVPIVGVPGFRPEFPGFAFLANRASLDGSSERVKKVQFARANCPFDFFHTVLEVHEAYGFVPMQLAPIGTKPHGLGAVLYALSRVDTVRLIYDHPVKKTQRTVGRSRVCVYDVSSFCTSSLFKVAADAD